MDEYDFLHDTTTQNLNIKLRPESILRTYQEDSVQRMFREGKLVTQYFFSSSFN